MLQARAASPDPDSFGGATPNPQTLNLYAYVKNNPLIFVDPTGHWAEDIDTWRHKSFFDELDKGRDSKREQERLERWRIEDYGCLYLGMQPQTQNPTINNATPEQKEAIIAGNDEAEKRLEVEPCAAFFGGTDVGLKALNGLVFTVNPSMPASGHPQGRINVETGTVEINPNGPKGSGFLTPKNSSYTFFILDPAGKVGFREITLTGAQASAFAQMHETAHRAKRFGVTDEDRSTEGWANNFRNNWKIWNACFKEAKPKPPQGPDPPGLR